MEIPSHWSMKVQRYGLEDLICSICGRVAWIAQQSA